MQEWYRKYCLFYQTLAACLLSINELFFSKRCSFLNDLHTLCCFMNHLYFLFVCRYCQPLIPWRAFTAEHNLPLYDLHSTVVFHIESFTLRLLNITFLLPPFVSLCPIKTEQRYQKNNGTFL